MADDSFPLAPIQAEIGQYEPIQLQAFPVDPDALFPYGIGTHQLGVKLPLGKSPDAVLASIDFIRERAHNFAAMKGLVARVDGPHAAAGGVYVMYVGIHSSGSPKLLSATATQGGTVSKKYGGCGSGCNYDDYLVIFFKTAESSAFTPHLRNNLQMLRTSRSKNSFAFGFSRVVVWDISIKTGFSS